MKVWGYGMALLFAFLIGAQTQVWNGDPSTAVVVVFVGSTVLWSIVCLSYGAGRIDREAKK